MNIGIFGGSFNPIHIGHAMIANVLSENSDLDEVWIMPNRINPFKTSMPHPVSFAHRMKMAQLVADECRDVRVCGIEETMPEPSYTYNTLCELRRLYPEHQFKLIVGSDNMQVFEKWRNYDRIISEFGLLIYLRPNAVISADYGENIRIIRDVPEVLISSTQVRERLSEGLSVKFMVTDKVRDYIYEHRLYNSRQ